MFYESNGEAFMLTVFAGRTLSEITYKYYFNGAKRRRDQICHLHPFNHRLGSHFLTVYVGHFLAREEIRYSIGLGGGGCMTIQVTLNSPC
jgi:hypothetical protein